MCASSANRCGLVARREYPACAQHEALINHAFDGLDVAIVCPYDAAAIVAFGIEDLGQARAFAVGHASRLALPSERLEDVARAVGELATNSIRHGGGSGVLRIWAGRRPCRVRGA